MAIGYLYESVVLGGGLEGLLAVCCGIGGAHSITIHRLRMLDQVTDDSSELVALQTLRGKIATI
ncbi:hypothetical protein [Mycobacterium sp. DL440]|uniref:hypothetical protein n=1 Tax=Mycobacterium sp. DL440 TaxID=2675523 RepID=UPI0014223B0F|nr:hypothetical protein [Mycobacterium sp. DL440]